MAERSDVSYESYIFMLYVAKKAELPVRPLCKDERLKGPVQLLDGHLLFGPLVDGRAKRDPTHN